MVDASRETKLQKGDRIKVFHPVSGRWKKVVVKQVRVRRSRIQVCSDEDAPSSSSSSPEDALEWLDYSQVRYKRTRECRGASRRIEEKKKKATAGGKPEQADRVKQLVGGRRAGKAERIAHRSRRRLDFDQSEFSEEQNGPKAESKQGRVAESLEDEFGVPWETQAVPNFTLKLMLAELIDLKGRTTNVACMKESESKQVGVPFRPLPHVMYKMDYIHAENPVSQRTSCCIQHGIFPTRACVMSDSEQDDYRKYLLRPAERVAGVRACGDAHFIEMRSFSDVKVYMKQNSSVILNYRYKDDVILEPCRTDRSIRKSDVQIVLNLKRNLNCSVELNRLASSLDQNLKLPSLGLRLDLFISPELKSRLTTPDVSSLVAVIAGVEKHLTELIVQWNAEVFVNYLDALEARAGQADCGNAPPSSVALGEKTDAGIRFKAFLERVDVLGRRFCNIDSRSILSRLKNDVSIIKLLQMFSFQSTLLYSSILVLMRVDTALAGKDSNCLLKQVHILSRNDCRDSFRYEMIAKETICKSSEGHGYLKTEFFFPKDFIPDNYKDVVLPCDYDDAQKRYPAGVTTYTGLFSEEELENVEKRVLDIEASLEGRLLPESCYDRSQNQSSVRRTKLFFGARYLWTKEQIAGFESSRAGGIRLNVPRVPKWVRDCVEEPLVQSDILPKDFINSSAINIYHDGSEGIQSHYDDDSRFARPIVSLRTFSDSRLSFGTKFFGYVNGSFFVPMPRGCITVMEEKGYAANGIKHSVRAVDMTGKSVAIILRHVHHSCMVEAKKIFLEESRAWFEDLSLEHRERVVLDEDTKKARAQCGHVVNNILRQVQQQLKEERKEEAKQEKRVIVECKKVVSDLLSQVQNNLRAERKLAAVREAEERKVRAECAQAVKVILQGVRQHFQVERQMNTIVRGLVTAAVKHVKEEQKVRKIVEAITKSVSSGKAYKFFAPRKPSASKKTSQ
ncbi:RNA demethylase [Chloropicon primus]|nr:RNA demethylase [Chloropicon primus]